MQYQNGLAAVWPPELTQEALWGAFFARRTYSTAGQRTVALFRVNDLFMGERGKVDGAREIQLQIWAERRIIKAEILKKTIILRAVRARNHLIICI
ncbi:MAG: DUF3604 domain-containing protein [Planctomycetes bacterium]|nr:DUF3604 domain-containing protein [Planctomycetota bacterium]